MMAVMAGMMLTSPAMFVFITRRMCWKFSGRTIDMAAVVWGARGEKGGEGKRAAGGKRNEGEGKRQRGARGNCTDGVQNVSRRQQNGTLGYLH